MDSKVNRPSKIFIIVHFVAYFVIRPSFHRQPSKQWVPSSMMHIWFYLKNKRRLRSIKRACNTYRVSRKVLDSQNTKIRKVTLLLKNLTSNQKSLLDQSSFWIRNPFEIILDPKLVWTSCLYIIQFFPILNAVASLYK